MEGIWLLFWGKICSNQIVNFKCGIGIEYRLKSKSVGQSLISISGSTSNSLDRSEEGQERSNLLIHEESGWFFFTVSVIDHIRG